jgi:hypothetical protein
MSVAPTYNGLRVKRNGPVMTSALVGIVGLLAVASPVASSVGWMDTSRRKEIAKRESVAEREERQEGMKMMWRWPCDGKEHAASGKEQATRRMGEERRAGRQVSDMPWPDAPDDAKGGRYPQGFPA